VNFFTNSLVKKRFFQHLSRIFFVLPEKGILAHLVILWLGYIHRAQPPLGVAKIAFQNKLDKNVLDFILGG
jgi:hypothetical protein